ncbi:MAG: HEPN domain-containing protein [Prevotellaceae bacterium]|jgi:HEPN domain-containing protein|nr:HEPN domain-containing protein [Prevotellaceae bacterium]
MTNEEKTRHWINLSDEDLKAAAVLLNGKCYLYAGFMCHLTIEKIFKACYTKIKGDTPPFTHDLLYLAAKSGFDNLLTEEQQDFIAEVNPLNIEARYPEYKSSIAKTLTFSKCITLIERTKSLQQWIKEKILLTK